MKKIGIKTRIKIPHPTLGLHKMKLGGMTIPKAKKQSGGKTKVGF